MANEEKVIKLLNYIPKKWKKIPKNLYPIYSVYVNKDLNCLGAYLYKNQTIVITSYEGLDGFLEEYENQMQIIENATKDCHNWKEISIIKPLYFKRVDYKGNEILVSIFANSNSDRISIQLFVKKEVLLGFSTSLDKAEKFDLIEIAKTSDIVKEILTLIEKY